MTAPTRAAIPALAAALPERLSARGAISRNAAWLLFGRLLAQGLAALFTIALARRFGVAEFGAYAFVSAAVFLANVVTTFGTDMVLIRDAAATRAVPARWAAALAVQLGLSAAAMAVAWLAAPLAGAVSADAPAALRIYSLTLLPAAAFSVLTAVLRGQGRMGGYAALGVAAAAIQLTVLVLLPGAGLVAVMAALVVVQIVSAALAWALVAWRSPALRRRPRTSAAEIRDMLRATGSIGVLGLLGVAYQRAPVLILAATAGPAATGWFAGASKIVEASKAGHVALFGAAYPAMAEAHAADRTGAPAFRDIAPDLEPPGLRWSRRLAIGGSVALSGLLLLASPIAARRLFGPAFEPSAAGLAILALSLVPSAFSTYQSLDLVARHRESATLRAQLVALASLVGLLGVLVPTVGWTGGCWAVLAAESIQAAALFAVRRGVGLRAGTRQVSTDAPSAGLEAS